TAREPAENPIRNPEPLRRVVVLCHNFLRSFEYYLAAEMLPQMHRGTAAYVYVATRLNLNACVLDWCKLLGDPRGTYRPEEIFEDVAGFESGLLTRLGTDAEGLAAYLTEMRRYRDKYLAHLDDIPTISTPFL